MNVDRASVDAQLGLDLRIPSSPGGIGILLSGGWIEAVERRYEHLVERRFSSFVGSHDRNQPREI